jgi:hypothetical protein
MPFSCVILDRKARIHWKISWEATDITEEIPSYIQVGSRDPKQEVDFCFFEGFHHAPHNKCCVEWGFRQILGVVLILAQGFRSITGMSITMSNKRRNS